jgi:hypothetical protein
MEYKIKWFKFVYVMIICPILGGILWHRHLESLVVCYLILNQFLILGYLNPKEFRK